MKQEFKKTYQRPKRRCLMSLGPFSSFALPPSHYLPTVSLFLRLPQSRCSVWPGGSMAVVSQFCSGTRSHPASSCSQWWVSLWTWFTSWKKKISWLVDKTKKKRRKNIQTTWTLFSCVVVVWCDMMKLMFNIHHVMCWGWAEMTVWKFPDSRGPEKLLGQ